MKDPFEENNEVQVIEIRYTDVESLAISNVSEFLQGFEAAIRESGKSLKSVGFEVKVLPITEGSVKFRTLLLGTALTIEILSNLNGAIELIQKFGASRVYRPDKEVIESLNSKELSKLCGNKDFIEGAKGIVAPLKETHSSVKITLNNEGIEISCDSVDKFFEPFDEEETIFPELIHGKEVELLGEMSRLNKSFNDIGFLYEGVPLKAIPFTPTETVAQYHKFLEEPLIVIKAVVWREDRNKKPELRIMSIYAPQERLFEDNN